MLTQTLIDLTHSLGPEVPSWNGSCCFHLKTVLDHKDCSDTVKFKVQEIICGGGIGTHIDAPIHCFADGISIDQIPLTTLHGPVVVIDVTAIADASYKISVADIHTFEKIFGPIEPGTFVIGNTGWSRYWSDPKSYRNPDSNGVMHFPTFSKEAAELLLKRGIVGLGIDTLSPDAQDSGFPVHEALLRAGKYIVENIANAHLLPPVGASILVAPMKIEHGSEAPVRLFGIVDRE